MTNSFDDLPNNSLLHEHANQLERQYALTEAAQLILANNPNGNLTFREIQRLTQLAEMAIMTKYGIAIFSYIQQIVYFRNVLLGSIFFGLASAYIPILFGYGFLTFLGASVVLTTLGCGVWYFKKVRDEYQKTYRAMLFDLIKFRIEHPNQMDSMPGFWS